MRSGSFKLLSPLLSGLIAFSGLSAESAPLVTGKVSSTPPPFPVASGVSHLIQKYSGATMVTNGALSLAASTALSLKLRTLVRAKVRSYSFIDMLAGKYRSVDIKTAGGSFHGIPIGALSLANNGPFRVRYFRHKQDKPGVVIPVMVSVTGRLRKQDLARALKSSAVVGSLRFLKLDLPGLGEQRLQVLDPQIDLSDAQIHLRSWLITYGAPKETGFQLDVLASPRLEKERFIMLKDMRIVSGDIPDREHFAVFLEELFNPLFDFGHLDRKTHAFRLSKFEIHNDEIVFDGRLLLAPVELTSPSLPSAKKPQS